MRAEAFIEYGGLVSFARTSVSVIAIVLAGTFHFAAQQPSSQTTAAEADDAIKTLVSRLELEKYKATIKGLTQFGDRRQGTDRNRAAIN